jgi:hypothetical protein
MIKIWTAKSLDHQAQFYLKYMGFNNETIDLYIDLSLAAKENTKDT